MAMTCGVCGKDTGGTSRQIGNKYVCMKCNPFRRCGHKGCLGLVQSASTPNDMGRHKCEKCGRISHR